MIYNIVDDINRAERLANNNIENAKKQASEMIKKSNMLCKNKLKTALKDEKISYESKLKTFEEEQNKLLDEKLLDFKNSLSQREDEIKQNFDLVIKDLLKEVIQGDWKGRKGKYSRLKKGQG